MPPDRLTLRYGRATYYSPTQGRLLRMQAMIPASDLTDGQKAVLTRAGWILDSGLYYSPDCAPVKMVVADALPDCSGESMMPVEEMR